MMKIIFAVFHHNTQYSLSVIRPVLKSSKKLMFLMFWYVGMNVHDCVHVYYFWEFTRHDTLIHSPVQLTMGMT